MSLLLGSVASQPAWPPHNGPRIPDIPWMIQLPFWHWHKYRRRKNGCRRRYRPHNRKTGLRHWKDFNGFISLIGPWCGIGPIGHHGICQHWFRSCYWLIVDLLQMRFCGIQLSIYSRNQSEMWKLFTHSKFTAVSARGLWLHFHLTHCSLLTPYGDIDTDQHDSYQRSRLRCPISKISMILPMEAKIWMASLIIMFAVRPICTQDAIFKCLVWALHIMACGLTTPSHYLNKCWLTSSLRDLMLKPTGHWMDPYIHLS